MLPDHLAKPFLIVHKKFGYSSTFPCILSILINENYCTCVVAYWLIEVPFKPVLSIKTNSRSVDVNHTLIQSHAVDKY